MNRQITKTTSSCSRCGTFFEPNSRVAETPICNACLPLGLVPFEQQTLVDFHRMSLKVHCWRLLRLYDLDVLLGRMIMLTAIIPVVLLFPFWLGMSLQSDMIVPAMIGAAIVLIPVGQIINSILEYNVIVCKVRLLHGQPFKLRDLFRNLFPIRLFISAATVMSVELIPHMSEIKKTFWIPLLCLGLLFVPGNIPLASSGALILIFLLITAVQYCRRVYYGLAYLSVAHASNPSMRMSSAGVLSVRLVKFRMELGSQFQPFDSDSWKDEQYGGYSFSQQRLASLAVGAMTKSASFFGLLNLARLKEEKVDDLFLTTNSPSIQNSNS